MAPRKIVRVSTANRIRFVALRRKAYEDFSEGRKQPSRILVATKSDAKMSRNSSLSAIANPIPERSSTRLQESAFESRIPTQIIIPDNSRFTTRVALAEIRLASTSTVEKFPALTRASSFSFRLPARILCDISRRKFPTGLWVSVSGRRTRADFDTCETQCHAISQMWKYAVEFMLPSRIARKQTYSTCSTNVDRLCIRRRR